MGGWVIDIYSSSVLASGVTAVVLLSMYGIISLHISNNVGVWSGVDLASHVLL